MKINKIKAALAMLIVFTVLTCACGIADGLFPSSGQLFGEVMPSVALAIGRTADADDATWSDFTEEEYRMLGQYLAGDGCSLADTTVEGTVVTFTVSKNDAKMTVIYEPGQQKLNVRYSDGCRIETDSATAAEASLLPEITTVFATEMPTMAGIVSWAPSTDNVGADGNRTLTYVGISETDYETFGRLLGGAGCTLQSISATDGKIIAEILKGYGTLNLIYDPSQYIMSLTYNSYVIPAELIDEGTNILLTVDSAVGKALPSIAQALNREPNEEEFLDDGTLKQTFLSFDDNSYNLLGSYLGAQGCTITDYTVDR